MIKRAYFLAKEAHSGVRRRSGEPYMLHPIAVAQIAVDEIGLGSKSVVAALLHDVVEDTRYTFRHLEKMGFEKPVIDALKLLTHNDGSKYMEYVAKIKNNPIARKVKLADLAHNRDQSRCVGSGLSEERKAAWRLKYEKATKILTEI